MKKVLISLGVIAVVAAIGISATLDYFSDTATITGNTITAGTLDLQVDSNPASGAKLGQMVLPPLQLADLAPGFNGSR
jgi:predicted ribosomally synthesized peptide with SipW-like signal peptide